LGCTDSNPAGEETGPNPIMLDRWNKVSPIACLLRQSFPRGKPIGKWVKDWVKSERLTVMVGIGDEKMAPRRKPADLPMANFGKKTRRT